MGIPPLFCWFCVYPNNTTPLILFLTLEPSFEIAPAATAVPWLYPPATILADGHSWAARVRRFAIVLIASCVVPPGRKLSARAAAENKKEC